MLESIPKPYDYLGFSILALATVGILHFWLWRKRRDRGNIPLLIWIATFAILVCGWWMVEQAGLRESGRIQRMLEHIAPTYAQELELMGHSEIDPNTDPEDPRYLAMIEAQKRWLRTNPNVKSIYTMRKLPDGALEFIVCCEVDYDGNGLYEGENESRVVIGERYDEEEEGSELYRAFKGVRTFSSEPVEDRWGTWISANVPMRDATGRLDAVLGVDYDATTWIKAGRRGRMTTFGYLAVLVLMFAGTGATMSMILSARELAEHKRAEATLRVSNEKFETLVNSIDGVVWECDPETFAFAFVSEQAESLLGFPLEKWTDEPGFWHDRLHEDDRRRVTAVRLDAVARRLPYQCEYRVLREDGGTIWLKESAHLAAEPGKRKVVRGVFLDITAQKVAQSELETVHRQLLETSRQAGMAEVATGVLHNVGNVLNSVNVSATLIGDRVIRSRASGLGKAAQLLVDHRADIAAYLKDDPKGKVLPDYLVGLSEHLAKEQQEITSELRLVLKNIEHIKDIVAMQQSYAKVSGLIEPVPIEELLEDALRMNAASFTRHGVDVVREIEPVPPVAVDKHKVLQILVNLTRNAKHALDDSGREDKRLTLGVSRKNGERVAIRVEDNGTGIAPENLARIFAHGFTTKRNGHGFGLHSGAIAAREMGGTLTVHSDGSGKGAVFTLELPLAGAPSLDFSP